MIHIVSAKNKKYMVVNIARNGEVLSTSEILSSKQKCYQNARALLRDCFGVFSVVVVQDDTGKVPIVYVVSLGNKVKSMKKPERKYSEYYALNFSKPKR